MYMNRGQKKALESFLGGMGVVFIMLGIFTSLEFMVGLIIAMFFWISSGAISQLLEEEDPQRPQKSYPRSDTRQSQSKVSSSTAKTEWSNNSPSSRYCAKCGEEIEENSFFCTSCGEKFTS